MEEKENKRSLKRYPRPEPGERYFPGIGTLRDALYTDEDEDFRLKERKERKEG